MLYLILLYFEDADALLLPQIYVFSNIISIIHYLINIWVSKISKTWLYCQVKIFVDELQFFIRINRNK